MLCPNSKNAILRSCGAGLAAVDDLMKKNEREFFVQLDHLDIMQRQLKAMGFCFINNAAVAARYLQKKYKINKVAIIDFDVHHGNGTQEIFIMMKLLHMAHLTNILYFPGQDLKKKSSRKYI